MTKTLQITVILSPKGEESGSRATEESHGQESEQRFEILPLNFVQGQDDRGDRVMSEAKASLLHV